MSQESTVQEPRLAVLSWQVVEQRAGADAWVIAAFDDQRHAEAFAETREAANRGLSRTVTVRVDPKWVHVEAQLDEIRALYRSPGVTAELAGRDV